MTGKYILVTGATGYVGTVLFRALQEAGYAAHSLKVRLVPGELAMACGGTYLIIHCAAELRDRTKMYQTNVIGTKSLAAAAVLAGVKHFLYVSTASTRDTEYVRTKRKGEQIVAAYSEQMSVQVIRLPTLYGGRRGPKWLQAVKLWLQGRPINLQSRQEAVRDIVQAVEQWH